MMLSLWAAAVVSVDFGEGSGGEDWYVVNDGVMGGLSEGRARLTPNSILFEGEISLRNNGGFSALRDPFGARDLSGFRSVEIRYKSSGQDFAYTLEKSPRFWIPNYKMPLPDSQGDWVVVTHKLLDFEESRLGKPTGAKVDQAILSQIVRTGFINTGKQAGPFRLEVDYVRFE